MGKLDGKIALITGGSEGIGYATAQQFLAEGAEHVYITGRRQEVLDEAVKKLDSKNVSAIQADASNPADLDKAYSIIKDEKGHLDILVANAGMTGFCPLDEITEEYFDYIFNINVKGVLFTVQKASPIFSDGGSIVLNGSIASIRVSRCKSVYCASKAAVRSFAAIKDAVPMNRLGEPEEIAIAVVFLSSGDSSYITGIELFVDGGLAQI